MVGVHADAAPALEVDHLDHAIADGQEVAGAEAAGHILAEIQPVLHSDVGIGARQADGLDHLNAVVDVHVRDLFGLIRVEIIVPVLGILALDDVLRHVAEVPVELQFTQLMKESTLFGVHRGFVLELRRQHRAGRTLEPAFRGRGAKLRVPPSAVLNYLVTHSFATSAIMASYLSSGSSVSLATPKLFRMALICARFSGLVRSAT